MRNGKSHGSDFATSASNLYRPPTRMHSHDKVTNKSPRAVKTHKSSKLGQQSDPITINQINKTKTPIKNKNQDKYITSKTTKEPKNTNLDSRNHYKKKHTKKKNKVKLCWLPLSTSPPI